MALVVRPAKQGGFLTYAAKVAAGFTKILSAEFDADFAAIIAQVNGFLDASNILAGSITNTLINAAAGIAYSKLNLAGSIVNADIATTAAIVGSKLAPGIATRQFFQSINTGGGGIVAETTVGTQAITAQGGTILAIGLFTGSIVPADEGISTIATIRMRRDTSILQYPGPTDCAFTQAAQRAAAGSVPTVPVAIAIPFLETPPTGVRTYTLTVQRTSGNGSIAFGPSAMLALELR